MSEVLDPRVAEAIDGLTAHLDVLLSGDFEPRDAADARALIAEMEVIGRRFDAARVRVVDGVERSGAHRVDGHASAKVMVRHVARLSKGEAAGRARSAKALRRLPGVKASFGAGRIGACQVGRIARAHANPRVRAAVEDQEASFVSEAETSDFRDFDRNVASWVDAVDVDGARDRDQRSHENRDVRLVQDFDGTWRLTGSVGSLQGWSWRRCSRRS